MTITQANLDYMSSKGCKLTISGVEAYAGMVIPSAPTFRIDIIDGSLFPINGSQFITTDTINNYDMKANIGSKRQTISQKFSASPKVCSFNLTTIPYYEFKQTDIDTLNAQNVKAYINDVLVIAGSKLKSGTVLKFVCNEGYKFDTENTLGKNPQPRYSQQRMAQTTNTGGQLPLNNEGTIATLNIVNDSTFYIYNTFTYLTVPYTQPKPKFVCMVITQAILNKLINVKLLVNNVEVVLGQELHVGDVLKLQANSNYYLGISNELVSSENYQLNETFNTGGGSKPTTGNLTLQYENTYNDINISVFPISVKLFTITQEIFDYIESKKINMLCNGTYIYSGRVLVQGDNLNIKPKAEFKLVLNNCYFLDEYNSPIPFQGTESNANLSLTDSTPLSSLVLESASIYNPETDIRLTFDSDMQAKLQTNNASMFINNAPISIGSTAVNGDVIRIKANSGYELADKPSFYIYSDNSGHQGSFKLDLIDENINAEKVIDLNYDNYLTNLEVITTQIDIVAGANNLYKINKADLKQINIDRFVTNGGNPPSVIDYGTNILGVINLPFNIAPEYIQDPELIKLGTHETTVTAPKVVTDKLYLNLGDISVPMPENSLGFTNATALIHLPYANSLTLDINAVMGQVINVEYVIDLYNGNSYVNIKSNKSDSIIASSSVDLGINIPYSSMLGDNNTVYNSNMSLGGDNHVKTPYIEIIQNMPILGNGFFTAPITAESKLNNEKGFIQVDNINLNVTATSNEKDMILTALRSGVIIND